MRRSRWAALAAVLALGCNYGFQGGGGFPSSIRTVFIEPFEIHAAQTASAVPVPLELESELTRKLQDEIPRQLGLRLAGRQAADAIVRGRIVRYDDVAQNYRAGQPPGGQVVQHQVSVTISVEILDVEQNLILWESSSLTGRGEYSLTSQTDAVARADAIEDLVRLVVDGAQSQW